MGSKNKKVYVLDDNGECVPLIDKKTGQQKVNNRNSKQWKCQTVESTDWNSQENAKMWRKDLADTINATNEQLGIDVHWEHRSFTEQGIDKEPTIHIGAVANALERKGVQTERGNINREIVKRNMMLEPDKEQRYQQLETVHLSKGQKLNRLKEKSKTTTEFYAEVISYNKKNLDRELQNEIRQYNKQQSRTKRREEFNENMIEI